MTIYAKLNTFPGYGLLARELRNAFYREEEISNKLGTEDSIMINFYGLILTIEDCSNDKILKAKISEYLGNLKRIYSEHTKERKNHLKKRFHIPKPGTKLKDAISIAYHEALSDIALDLENGNTHWLKWIFIFKFNNVNYEFYPLNMNGYAKLTSDVKKR